MMYKSNRSQITKAINAGLIRGLDAAGVHYQREVKKALSGSSPSSPGTPPGVQTGALRRSAQIDRSRNRGKRPVVRVGSGLVYAAIHEFGGTIRPKTANALRFKLPDGSWRTAKQVVLPARPTWRPTFRRNRKTMQSLVAKSVNAAIDRASGLGPTGGGG